MDWCCQHDQPRFICLCGMSGEVETVYLTLVCWECDSENVEILTGIVPVLNCQCVDCGSIFEERVDMNCPLCRTHTLRVKVSHNNKARPKTKTTVETCLNCDYQRTEKVTVPSTTAAQLGLPWDAPVEKVNGYDR